MGLSLKDVCGSSQVEWDLGLHSSLWEHNTYSPGNCGPKVGDSDALVWIPDLRDSCN